MAFMAPIGLAATAGSGLLGAFGAMAGGNAQAAQYSYLAGVSRANAEIAQQNASYERFGGETKALQYGMAAAQRAGKIGAAQAASGFSVSGGSAQKVQESQAAVSRMDMGQIRENASRIAYGYDIQASQALQQAGLYDAAASSAKKSGMLGALGSLVSATASVSSKWMQGESVGLWDTNSNPVDVGYASTYYKS